MNVTSRAIFLALGVLHHGLASSQDLRWDDLDANQQSYADYCLKNTALHLNACMSIAKRHTSKDTFMSEIGSEIDKNVNREKGRHKDATKKVVPKPGVSIGMTDYQVLTQSNWGKPKSINRTITATGTNEQWVYHGRNYLYFQNGLLYAIQTE